MKSTQVESMLQHVADFIQKRNESSEEKRSVSTEGKPVEQRPEFSSPLKRSSTNIRGRPISLNAVQSSSTFRRHWNNVADLSHLEGSNTQEDLDTSQEKESKQERRMSGFFQIKLRESLIKKLSQAAGI